MRIFMSLFLLVNACITNDGKIEQTCEDLPNPCVLLVPPDAGEGQDTGA